MGSRSKYRGPWWPYGRASTEERMEQRHSWGRCPKILTVTTGRRAKRINRARRNRESKSQGEQADDT